MVPVPPRPIPVRALRRRLLQGASVAAVVSLMGGPQAFAQVAVFRGAAHLPAGTGAPSVAVPVVPGLATSPAANAGAARILRNASKAQQSVNMALQAQAAARQSVAASSTPNGLVAGGLVPVANPVLAAKD